MSRAERERQPRARDGGQAVSRGAPGSEWAGTPVPELEGAKGTRGGAEEGPQPPGEAGSGTHAVTGAGESARPGGQVSS